MNGGGGDTAPPPNGGEYLLSLIQKPHNHTHPQSHPTPPQPPPQQSPALDPAVALMGPMIPAASQWPSNGHDHLQPHPLLPLSPWSHTLSSSSSSSPSPYPQNFFGLTHNPFPPLQALGNHYPSTPIATGNVGINLSDDLRRLGFSVEGNNSNNHNIHNIVDAFVQQQKQQELKLKFGSLPNDVFVHDVPPNGDSLLNLKFNRGYNGFDGNLHVENPRVISNPNAVGNPVAHGNCDVVEHERRGVGVGRGNGGFHGGGNHGSETIRAPPPGFGNKARGRAYWGSGGRRKGSEADEGRVGVVDSGRLVYGERSNIRSNVAAHELGLPEQLDRPGPPAGSKLHSVSASDVEDSRLEFQSSIVDDGVRGKKKGVPHSGRGGGGGGDVEVLGEQLGDSLMLEDEPDDKNKSRQLRLTREKDARSSDSRGKQLLSQRARMYKRQMICRRDINSLNVPFLAIYESLIPREEEKVKQKQLLGLLEKLVSKEWPKARLYLYGSCASSFGVSKSDIDVCLAIEEKDMDKSEILMKLADILQSDNLQNVQALTRARVPIVKLMDPVTGISCDICINNLLAVVNTKLLRDYAHIDARLRQLAFIIKHWAKSRGVNETYHGTLSSYAYVLMCIHFLQQRRPAILPCLQEMDTTYSVTVDDVNCAFFDRVEKLCDFGHLNKETIAQLVWGFFYYWAYCHDYANAVISVRMGSTISKREKDWTRRIGNDRHLICIEDPFEVSHDLGRVVDKHSIKVLREEFERAADIMQFDPNPCVKLFEPYVRS